MGTQPGRNCPYFKPAHSKLPSPVEEDLSKGILEAVDLDSYRAEIKQTMSILLEEQAEYAVGPVPTGAEAEVASRRWTFKQHPGELPRYVGISTGKTKTRLKAHSRYPGRRFKRCCLSECHEEFG